MKKKRKAPAHAHLSDIKRKVMIDGLMLALPLLFGFGWHVNPIFSGTFPIGGEQLAPSKIEPLLLFILGFILVYGLFLFYEYRLLYKKWHGISQ